MPLPNNNTIFPPIGWQGVFSDYALHSAWFSGDPNTLAMAYASQASPFWAREIGVERRTTLHVPVAGDISSVSAAMLFGEHPKITCKNTATQKRLDDIISATGVYSLLAEAAETSSAMGGVILKINWDTNISGYPLLSVAQADNAIPEWRNGILTGRTLFRELVCNDDNASIWRLVERHEPGVIFTGLYKGSGGSLGSQVSLELHSESAGLLPVIQTGLKGLACVYIPNVRPNRKFRGWRIGRSDYAGCEGLFDSIDEAYSSLMRDIRLGVGRIIAPEQFFEVGEDADGKTKRAFDVNREVYMGMHAIQSGEDLNSNITVTQFAVRSAEHLATIGDLMIRAFTTAGYSPQSFGLQVEGSAESGTALRIRERKSFSTSQKKAEYWRPALEYILTAMLEIDKQHLSGGPVDTVQVEMQDSVITDIGDLAASVELLKRAESASDETRVRMLHPDWEDKQVADEVAAINEQRGMNVPDPVTIGRGANNDGGAADGNDNQAE